MLGRAFSDETGNFNHVDHFFLVYVPTLDSLALITLTYLSSFYFGRSLRIGGVYCLTSALEAWCLAKNKYRTSNGLDLFLKGKGGNNQIGMWLDSHAENFKYDLSNRKAYDDIANGWGCGDEWNITKS